MAASGAVAVLVDGEQTVSAQVFRVAPFFEQLVPDCGAPPLPAPRLHRLAFVCHARGRPNLDGVRGATVGGGDLGRRFVPVLGRDRQKTLHDRDWRHVAIRGPGEVGRSRRRRQERCHDREDHQT